ncbi:MAG TPA: ATP-binding protein [Solirubrobacteraceae bacterium]|nr:ATP-binding protein [Solirubrobacteraceae bacterium]
MSTTAFRGAMRRRLTDRSWQLTAAAGALALVGMAVALEGGATAFTVAPAAIGVLVGAFVLVPRALRAARGRRAPIVLAAVLGVAAIWVALWLLRVPRATPGPLVSNGWQHLLPLLLILGSAAAGMVFVADAVRVWLGLAPRQRAPWKQMTETRSTQSGIAWRAVAGVALVGWAAFLAAGVVARMFAAYSLLQLIAMLMIVGGVALLLGMPVAIGAFLRVSRDKAGTAHDRERQRFAAHLHDSVLQTLALVQRQAHDPVAVARMARRQEHALRAWMAGEAELVSDTVVAALRDAVAEVEDEHGITVEFSAIGDRALDPTCEELVAAAREALRNAARHGHGAPVFVFCHVGRDGQVELFVRDEGPGFDPAAVPAERRGIRDAIVGRMAFAGGQAKVESVSGEGTEVTLRVPARKGTR